MSQLLITTYPLTTRNWQKTNAIFERGRYIHFETSDVILEHMREVHCMFLAMVEDLEAMRLEVEWWRAIANGEVEP